MSKNKIVAGLMVVALVLAGVVTPAEAYRIGGPWIFTGTLDVGYQRVFVYSGDGHGESISIGSQYGCAVMTVECPNGRTYVLRQCGGMIAGGAGTYRLTVKNLGPYRDTYTIDVR